MGAHVFEPLDTLVRLDATARAATPLPRSADAWRAINCASGERVMGMSAPTIPADLHPENWEMHPDGDELLFLLDGAIDVMLAAENGGDGVLLPLRRGQACLVESGTWHRLLLRAPSRLMFVTPAGGTRMRPWREDRCGRS